MIQEREEGKAKDWSLQAYASLNSMYRLCSCCFAIIEEKYNSILLGVKVRITANLKLCTILPGLRSLSSHLQKTFNQIFSFLHFSPPPPTDQQFTVEQEQLPTFSSNRECHFQ